MTHLELEDETVTRQVSLTGEQVESEEPVIPPTLPDLKVRGKLSDNVLGGVSPLVDHLHPVLVLAGVGEAGAKFQED